MVHKLSYTAKDFEEKFSAFLNLREESEKDISRDVSAIVAEVRKNGDKALIAYSKKFGDGDYTEKSLRFTDKDIATALKTCDKDALSSLKLAAKRIASYHKKQLPKDLDYTDADGVKLGWKWTAIDAVGMYVPGGMASYPSSVLMNAIPATVAGVKRLVMVVPTPGGVVNPAILAAAHIADVKEIYRVGGAQAVAALAYGTKTIAPVDKIVGPGNAYVAEAKRQVFGKVGIDMIAGPSEILVVADKKNDPYVIAADLLSQAEHDATAQSILITDDANFAAAVEKAVKDTLKTLPRANIATPSWDNFGAIIVVDKLSNAVPLIDRIAPEHLELAIDKPELLAKKVSHAGAIFLGRHTPEAIGDYIAGPSHVLPTSQTARFSSGLGVLDFMKRTSLIGCTQKSLLRIGAKAAILADSEGLSAHALSIRARLKSK